MPQLDISSFYNQSFWLTIYTIELYALIFYYLILPVIFTLKVRNKSLESEKAISLALATLEAPFKSLGAEMTPSTKLATQITTIAEDQLKHLLNTSLKQVSSNNLYSKDLLVHSTLIDDFSKNVQQKQGTVNENTSLHLIKEHSFFYPIKKREIVIAKRVSNEQLRKKKLSRILRKDYLKVKRKFFTTLKRQRNKKIKEIAKLKKEILKKKKSKTTKKVTKKKTTPKKKTTKKKKKTTKKKVATKKKTTKKKKKVKKSKKKVRKSSKIKKIRPIKTIVSSKFFNTSKLFLSLKPFLNLGIKKIKKKAARKKLNKKNKLLLKNKTLYCI